MKLEMVARLTLAAMLVSLSTDSLGQYASTDHFPSQIQVERLRGSLSAAPPNLTPRPLNVIALSMIMDFEGWSATAYNDSAGYCTIGYGHLLALKSCSSIDLGRYADGLTAEQGLDLLEADTASARLAVQELVSEPLSDDEFGALTSFVFNVGKANFGTSSLLRFIESGDRDDASREFRRWIFAKGQVQPGLVTRRRCETNLFLGQLALDKQGKFSRANCAQLSAAGSGAPPIDIDVGEGS